MRITTTVCCFASNLIGSWSLHRVATVGRETRNFVVVVHKDIEKVLFQFFFSIDGLMEISSSHFHCSNKKLRYRRGNARHAMSVEILSTAAAVAVWRSGSVVGLDQRG